MSEDKPLPETEEEKTQRKFEKLCQSVKDNIGIFEIENKITVLGESVKNLLTEVGNTNQTVQQMIPHINRWIEMEAQVNQNNTAAQGTATKEPLKANQAASLLSTMPSQERISLIKDVLQGIGEGLKGAAEAYRTFKGDNQDSFLGIPHKIIYDNLQESVLGDFETGKNMREMLTTGMKRKVVTKLVNQMVDNQAHVL